MEWNAVITNGGKNLFASWVDGTTLTFDKAASGTGTVPVAALIAQTALVNQKQVVSFVGREKVTDGIKLKIQITAPAVGYGLNQIGIWGKIGGGASVLVAIFQRDTSIPIPSKTETPDFIYNFFAVLAVSNTGNFSVTIDPSAMVTNATMTAAIETAIATREGLLKNAALKETPVDADSLVLVDGTDGADKGKTKRITWSRIIAVLKGLFDERYAAKMMDVVVRTQEDFDALIASPTWLGAKSVLFVGSPSLKFTKLDGTGIVVPTTVRHIQGVHKATIDIWNNPGKPYVVAFGYQNPLDPTDSDYWVRDLTVECHANQAGYGHDAAAFQYMKNLTGCDVRAEGDSAVGFAWCENLISCTVSFLKGIDNWTLGFMSCAKLVDCRAICSVDEGGVFAYKDCTQLTNCHGSVSVLGGGWGGVYMGCKYVVNCTGEGGDDLFMNCEMMAVTSDAFVMLSAVQGIPVANWVADTQYASLGFVWRASINVPGITSMYVPFVTFSCADAMSGNFAPVATSSDGGVIIWCKTKPTTTTYLDSISCIRKGPNLS